MNAPVVIRRPGSGAWRGDLRDLLAHLYRIRKAEPPENAPLQLAHLHPNDTLLDMALASQRIGDQIRGDGHILIFGDYDADGATATAVAVRGLRAMGARRVSYLIPNRFQYGYGFTPAILEIVAARKPDLLITVDNGIASVEAVARANELGIPVIITDHHLPGARLPEATAILNPNRPGDPFPSKHLAGVGVIFYLLAGVRAYLTDRGWFHSERPRPNLVTLLDLVALGTVADVVSLDRNNRILVERGLHRIRSGQGNPGIRALFGIAKRNPDHAVAQDLGFGVAPRLNAAGRLEDMSLGVECLLADDPRKARDLAHRLEACNRKRRAIEREMQTQADAILHTLERTENGLPPAFCLYEPSWHQGVTGILAGRVRERWNRPVIAFASADSGILRGSGRSVEGLHLRDLLEGLHREHPELIQGFGGHAMAVGLTLKPEALEPFRAAFSERVGRVLGSAPQAPILLSDGELPPQLLTLDTATALRYGGPWGKDFPEPLFDGEFHVLETRVIGQSQEHLRLRVRAIAGGLPLDAVLFFPPKAILHSRGTRAHLAYCLDVNAYRGRLSPQLLVKHLEWRDD